VCAQELIRDADELQQLVEACKMRALACMCSKPSIKTLQACVMSVCVCHDTEDNIFTVPEIMLS